MLFEQWQHQLGATWHTYKEKAQFVPGGEEAGCPSIERYLLISGGIFPRRN